MRWKQNTSCPCARILTQTPHTIPPTERFERFSRPFSSQRTANRMTMTPPPSLQCTRGTRSYLCEELDGKVGPDRHTQSVAPRAQAQLVDIHALAVVRHGREQQNPARSDGEEEVAGDEGPIQRWELAQGVHLLLL